MGFLLPDCKHFFLMTCFVHECSKASWGPLQVGYGRTGNRDPETWRGIEPHKVLLGQLWSTARCHVPTDLGFEPQTFWLQALLALPPPVSVTNLSAISPQILPKVCYEE